ncbi:HEAT repeat domain-containing protein [Methylotuvimicrobium buryatense]|uniref:HEAT repeat domain-containing protein n=2 Tax=Methylotuvimicrobium buryatense TaxID=95641 RepID=A0A4P9UTC0_METBY|nr:HEAT repeat domain-containing protein [Methylotuvimicrobium buryatense]QCW84798.1 HEAT repeat domain-containing protein [Methylotuvimicrobium buryatense]
MSIVKKRTIENAQNNDTKQIHRALPELIDAMESCDVNVRRLAARELAFYPEAAQTLVSCLKRECDSSVREVILTSLTRCDSPEFVEELADCLRSEDASLRNEVIEAMKAITVEVVPVMEQLLVDPDPDVRILAVNILESLRHPKVEQWLINIIERDSHVNVCAAAVDLLCELATEKSRPALEVFITRFSDEPYIRFAAELALYRIKANRIT